MYVFLLLAWSRNAMKLGLWCVLLVCNRRPVSDQHARLLLHCAILLIQGWMLLRLGWLWQETGWLHIGLKFVLGFKLYFVKVALVVPLRVHLLYLNLDLAQPLTKASYVVQARLRIFPRVHHAVQFFCLVCAIIAQDFVCGVEVGETDALATHHRVGHAWVVVLLHTSAFNQVTFVLVSVNLGCPLGNIAASLLRKPSSF